MAFFERVVYIDNATSDALIVESVFLLQAIDKRLNRVIEVAELITKAKLQPQLQLTFWHYHGAGQQGQNVALVFLVFRRLEPSALPGFID